MIRDKQREGVPEGFRKPLGEDIITKIYYRLKEKSYPNAIVLDTQNNSLEECERIIEKSF